MIRPFLILSCWLLCVASGMTQERFSVEGTVGSATNRGVQVFPLWLEGKWHLSSNLAAGVGVCLWQSGFKDEWFTPYNDETATEFSLSDNQTTPGFNLSVRGEWPLLKTVDRSLRLFIEPQLIVLPFTDRSLHLEEHYLVAQDPAAEHPSYVPRPVDPFHETQFNLQGSFHLGWSLRMGIAFSINEHVDYFLSIDPTSVDPFAAWKHKTLTTHERGTHIQLDAYRPDRRLFLLHLGFAYRFN